MSLDVSLVYLFQKRSIESAFIEFKVYWKHISVETRIAQKPNSSFTCIADHLTGFRYYTSFYWKEFTMRIMITKHFNV